MLRLFWKFGGACSVVSGRQFLVSPLWCFLQESLETKMSLERLQFASPCMVLTNPQGPHGPAHLVSDERACSSAGSDEFRTYKQFGCIDKDALSRVEWGLSEMDNKSVSRVVRRDHRGKIVVVINVIRMRLCFVFFIKKYHALKSIFL